MGDDVTEVILYTDGACSGNPGPGGWAAILKHPTTGRTKQVVGGAQRTTNNKMELTAVIEGLKALKNGKQWRVRVVSDSQYVVHGMNEWIHGWIANNWRRGKKETGPPVKNAELWQELHALSNRYEVTFEHVRGHAGHPENEACDRLAVEQIRKMRQEAQDLA